MDRDIEEALRKEINRQDAEDAKIRREPSFRVDSLAHDIIGAAIEVHRHLGPGFLETVYEQALRVELRARGIAFETQVSIPVVYKGEIVGDSRLDLLVSGELVVELKAVSSLDEIHRAQVLSYLRAGCFELGLLINFCVPVLKHGIRRIVCTR